MMDRFALAQQHYGTIHRRATLPPTPHLGEQYARWIQRDVVPVVEEFIAQAEFRELAKWSLDHLCPGSSLDERKRVEEVDRSLVDWAQAMLRYADQSRVRRTLIEHGALTGAFNASQASTTTPDGMGVVRFVAEHPWRDLVSARDYLAPTDGLNLPRNPAADLKPAEFVPLLDRYLCRPGDHVAGMLLRRVDYWRRALESFASRCSSVAQDLKGHSKLWQSVGKAQRQFRELATRLHAELCTGPQFQQRDSAMALVQAYAAFHPRPKLDWLGATPMNCSPASIYEFWLVNHAELDVAGRIASALTDMAPLFYLKPPPEDVLKQAARSHRLVIAQGMGVRHLYWDGDSIDARPLRGHGWDVLWTLVSNARIGQGIDHSDLDDEPSAHALTCRINQLKRKLPPGLAQNIVRGDAKATYKLKLPSGEIFQFEIDEDGCHELDKAELDMRSTAVRRHGRK